MPDYTIAINKRKSIIRKLRTNPPADWSPEYVSTNIDAVEKQIKHLAKLHNGINHLDDGEE